MGFGLIGAEQVLFSFSFRVDEVMGSEEGGGRGYHWGCWGWQVSKKEGNSFIFFERISSKHSLADLIEKNELVLGIGI